MNGLDIIRRQVETHVGQTCKRVRLERVNLCVGQIQTRTRETAKAIGRNRVEYVPAQKDYVIGSKELSMMKDNSAIINAARGGVIDEVALVSALDSNKLAFACLDTFENEPKPEIKLLMHPKISLTPHIGAATLEAQDRIGVELGQQIISILG